MGSYPGSLVWYSSDSEEADSMLETHLNGSKHLKKMKQLGQEDVSTNFVLEDEMQQQIY